ncbi:hypothetical protein LC608_33695 [Nostoc sp. XA010]|uniref:hypothetical protein n=1 Tax=Nostoc sp. XA010 TaxID=2780407 RepID=UPI001E2BAD3C|nr:hypothetical protein [Nostoc sp. XA010]MCC5661814.1 hypothetical protein [Nostoc sp. XA010]
MKSDSFVLVALIVFIWILVNAIASLIAPIVRHYWLKYQHYKMVEERRARFYRELKMLMTDRAIA